MQSRPTQGCCSCDKLSSLAVAIVVLHRAKKVSNCLSINSAVRLLPVSQDLNNIAGSRTALVMMLDDARDTCTFKE